MQVIRNESLRTRDLAWTHISMYKMFPRRTIKTYTLIITHKLTTTLRFSVSDIISLSLTQLYMKHISTHGIQHEFIFICAKQSNINPPQQIIISFSHSNSNTRTYSTQHELTRALNYQKLCNRLSLFNMYLALNMLKHAFTRTRTLNSNIFWVESHMPCMRCELKCHLETHLTKHRTSL